MKIEKISKTVEVEVNKYVSDDGKEFDAFVDCERYEMDKKLKELGELVKNIEQKIIGVPFSNPDYSYTWFYLKNKDDAGLLSEYYLAVQQDNDSVSSNISDMQLCYPLWVCVEAEDDGFVWSVTTKDEYITTVFKETAKLLDKI